MTRILLGIVATGIILTIGATTAFAAGLHNRCAGGAGIGICRNGESCGYYADADGDGICDNAAAWSGAGHHGGCGEGCRESRCGANRR